MKDKLYYFAHPYTVKDDMGNNIHSAEKANFELANIRAGHLLKRGYMVYSPISHSHPIHVADPDFLKDNEYKLWMKLDKLIMPVCEGLILAPNWETSKGCLFEKKEFKKRGLEILLYNDIMRGKKIDGTNRY